MKSAASNKAGLHVAQLSATSPLSQIPLPRRKNSAKGDKGLDVDDTDGSEYGHDAVAPRSQAKMSLLGSTSFCCASGQKEDYIPDARIVPAVRPPKKRPPNIAKKEGGLDPSTHTPKSPLLAAGRSLLARNKKGKASQDSAEEIQVHSSETSTVKLSQEDIKVRPGTHSSDSRIRPVDDRRKITPPSPQHRTQKEPIVPRRDHPDARKYSDAFRKYRKDSNPNQAIGDPSYGKAKKCKHANDANSSTNPKFLGSRTTENDMSVLDACTVTVSACTPRRSELSVKEASSDSVSNDAMVGSGEVLNNPHQSEDFDCPCCDRTSIMMDEAGLSDIEVKMFTSCDVIAPVTSAPQEVKMEITDTCETTEETLQIEVKSLKEDLQAERLKLQTQQDLVQHLEEELSVMQQLRQELDKEKELRKIAEDKLLELLDYEKRLDVQKKENEKRMESKCTQMDLTEPVHDILSTEKNSPLLYEGRLRKYQTYIAKLEKDNLMLVNELKKFKDMSPRSQEEQAKILMEKLGQMERNNHQQQLQYETCLDEVANKLVQTLLAQKRLEEECKVLHLRVEQLEQENGTLMELIDEDKDEKVNENAGKEESVKATNVPSTNSNLQHRRPSHHPLTSSPVKKSSTSQKHSIPSEERKKDSPKSTNVSPVKSACSEPRSPVQSPVSPGPKPGCASKIPSFGNTKHLLVRKKSETEMLSTKSKNEVPSREAPSSELVPNPNPSAAPPSSRSKLPSSTKGTKGTSAKRKRFSRNASPSDKGVKESKQRIKSNHIRWEPRKVSPEDVPPPYKSIDCMNELSPIPAFPPPQQVWSFNCEVNTNLPVPEIKRKIADSIEAFSDKLCCSLDHSDIKQNSSTSESSTTIEGVNRTRDEGYSTMSSDLQPDSAADTTISEPDPSATYVITEKADHCNSDDSVTECLDGSMCSSSDSGFGPLYQVATLKFPGELPAEEGPNRVANELPKFESSSRKHGTVKSKEQIASVKPTVRSVASASEQSQNSAHSDTKSNTVCDNFPCDSVKLNNSPDSHPVSPTKSKRTGDLDIVSPSKSPNEKRLPNVDQSTMIDYWNFPKEILGLKNYRRTWHLGPTKSIYDDQIVFCTRHSYIDDNLFDEKVETAEKATLTEPEEELWREKALAPFIDESIWSLYSSEGDIQVKHFPLEPLLSEPSLEKLITNCSPCIVVTENLESNPKIEVFDDFKLSTIKSSNNSSFSDLNSISGQNSEKFKSGLERVASDTVLYLKDAIHELENSMRRGLKSSKNIPALHQNSGSESEASPSRGFSLQPEILRTLEATMCEQDHLQWPSPSRSSSMSSLQSSTSCYVVSDEMEDVDMVRSSRKGSQDPDLSSASDAEYENLEHKDFVERWLQKEIVYNNNIPKMVPQLEPVAEIGEFSQKSLLKSSPSVRRKTSLPCDIIDRPILTRMRLKSYPTDCNGPKPFAQLSPASACAQTSSKSNIHLELTMPDNENYCTAGNPQNIDILDDADLECLDPEAKEFNGDFYTLCSIGSLKSLDRFSPSKTREMSLKQLVESPVFNRKSHPKSLSRALPTKSDRLKPTGLVKPTRPVTLAVTSVPSVPEHSGHKMPSGVSSSSDLKANAASKAISKVPCSTDSNTYAKINICPKVPLNNFSVFQNGGDGSQSHLIANPPVGASSSKEKSSLISLPASLASESAVAVKAKSPTKIIFRNGSPSKYEDLAKKQWKRDRIVARQNRLKEGCGTAWIHLQPNPALSDPSIRNNLLDSIKAPTSSSGSSSTEEDDSEVLVIHTNSHLHRICKERRHKVKASANNPLYDLRKRSSIMGRRELFYRFGDKEKEAIACFDFLEEIPSSSVETSNKRVGNPPGELLPVPTLPPSNLSLLGRKSSSIKERISLISPTVGDISKMAASSNHPSKMADFAKSPFPKYSARQLRLPNLWNKPLSHNMSSATLNSQDCELLDHISLSDSCAESYSSTPESYDDAS